MSGNTLSLKEDKDRYEMMNKYLDKDHYSKWYHAYGKHQMPYLNPMVKITKAIPTVVIATILCAIFTPSIKQMIIDMLLVWVCFGLYSWWLIMDYNNEVVNYNLLKAYYEWCVRQGIKTDYHKELDRIDAERKRKEEEAKEKAKEEAKKNTPRYFMPDKDKYPNWYALNKRIYNIEDE